MDIYIMQYNYRNNFLVIMDGDVYVYNYDNCKFDPPFLSFQAKMFLLVNRKIVL